MLYRAFLSLFLLVCLNGCGGPRYVDYFPYHDDGMAKPTIALLPLTDHSNFDCCWDLKEELAQEINYCCMDRAAVFLWPKKDVMAKVACIDSGVDYFGKDLSFSAHFYPCEFVVAIDIMEHQCVPYVRGTISPLYPIDAGKCDTVLKMKFRIRKIDVRGDEPCVVMQEILESNHMLPLEHDNTDYTRICYGTEWYNRTPLSRAHKRAMRDVTERIEKLAYRSR